MSAPTFKVSTEALQFNAENMVKVLREENIIPFGRAGDVEVRGFINGLVDYASTGAGWGYFESTHLTGVRIVITVGLKDPLMEKDTLYCEAFIKDVNAADDFIVNEAIDYADLDEKLNVAVGLTSNK